MLHNLTRRLDDLEKATFRKTTAKDKPENITSMKANISRLEARIRDIERQL